MADVLLVAVRLHDMRWHGASEWPPAPARLFQALVSAAAEGATLSSTFVDPLRWLEQLAAPVIAVPVDKDSKGFVNFVPNNDLDSQGGDPREISKIRAAKSIKPRLFPNGNTDFLYCWPVDDESGDAASARGICALATRLYQFGRGVDMAWANAEVVSTEEAEARLAAHPGTVHRPAQGGRAGNKLLCPTPGSLDSLVARHAASRRRFTFGPKQTLFTQPPKARFVEVAYDCPPTRWLFELRRVDEAATFAVWPARDVVGLVRKVRDFAVARLGAALPEQRRLVEAVLVGGTKDRPATVPRVRLLPLPSIGHTHADHGIRRILCEVPPDCPLRADDLKWALAGREILDTETGEMTGVLLVATDHGQMPTHYGIDAEHNHAVWQSVTPLALPDTAARRRIDPSRIRENAKGGRERAQEEQGASRAVLDALRHASERTPVVTVVVQREPFSGKGQRAESFATDRFGKHRLWHVQLTLAGAIAGPLVLGDGRWFGLGLMAPVRRS